MASATRYRPGQAAVAAVLAGAAMAGLLLYLRKRRQVAAHFTMGEGDLEGGNARTLETAGTGRS